MFNIKLRGLYYICNKIPIRTLRSRTKRSDHNPNPGLENRLRVFRKEGIGINNENAEEFVEQSDSNFYDVGQAYNQHLNETLIGKHELRHQIVKEKYFKENMPNLLTWSEKEQIRHLASTQPDEWTPKRIAESFPITESVAKKLLKYPWKPATEQRIARHDASAMRNWRELKEGTLDIPEDLRKHFLKFSERTIPPLNKKSLKVDLSSKKMGEFEQIIQKCAMKEEEKEKYRETRTEDQTIKENKNVSKKDNKMVTLDELTRKIKDRLEQGDNVNLNDHIIVDSINTLKTESSTKETNSTEIELTNENRETSLTNFKENNEEVLIDNYPERIRIPKKAYKRGATYKVNDCFYDDDGRFLYRVIGMTS
ncbi:hypothetical protein KGM_202141 [Danaus plexippus plexippus]|uniref:Uncharacterized protein n=1 Tax=Danaus plexippus plexippus TaxID=278856 RepID=A0A212FGR2_DANPL|nr:hypothetical protein KGM_202141 [Danaus plexippus plexippus]